MTAVTALQHQLHTAFPHLSFHARAILDALMLGGGCIGSTTAVAQRLGFPSRFALARMLRHQGLPGLRELGAWISLLRWLILAERSEAPLFIIATHSRRCPAVCYRTVKRLTGLTWVQLRERGSAWALRRFIARCRSRPHAPSRWEGLTLAASRHSTAPGSHPPVRAAAAIPSPPGVALPAPTPRA